MKKKALSVLMLFLAALLLLSACTNGDTTGQGTARPTAASSGAAEATPTDSDATASATDPAGEIEASPTASDTTQATDPTQVTDPTQATDPTQTAGPTQAPPTATAPTSITVVNDLMDANGEELTVYFVKPAGAEKKSDGFIFLYRNEIYVIDGGNKKLNTGGTADYLRKLRTSLLEANKLDPTNKQYRLRINLILSHFHTDHMAVWIDSQLAAPEFEIANVYCTPDSAFSKSEYVNNPKYCDLNKYGDIKNRVPFMQQLAKYHPEAQVHEVPFGTKQTVTSADGKLTFTLYGASEDWGAGSLQDSKAGLTRLAVQYYGYNVKKGTFSSSSVDTGLPTAIDNANSMWVKVTFGERTMLFTGDVVKKNANAYDGDEPFDKMLSYYGYEEFDVDVVKFPHHGVARNKATSGVVEVMKPKLIVFTVSNHTVDQQTTGAWTKYKGMWRDTNSGLTVVTDGRTVRASTDGKNFDTVM